ncbi:hypothetical protein HaLaN_24560 [Haematococcus lacustris]|uniref:Uncharacterized protein n=1 Tax=Haematococcus lacustris TaxID=44745 RepID=A0A6A0A313_HAELA|nr:hypothetical protein HaLaN_24560 [Haematococcus lacustris]
MHPLHHTQYTARCRCRCGAADGTLTVPCIDFIDMRGLPAVLLFKLWAADHMSTHHHPAPHWLLLDSSAAHYNQCMIEQDWASAFYPHTSLWAGHISYTSLCHSRVGFYHIITTITITGHAPMCSMGVTARMLQHM